MVLKVLFLFYTFDTAVTAYATARGQSIEINPLYWAFHDSLAKGLAVRVALGLAVFYWLSRYASPRLVRVVAGIYGTMLLWMTSVNIFLLL